MTAAKPSKPPKGDAAYRRLWRVVDGAVRDAFAHHPEYLTEKGRRVARTSIVKRVTGAVLSFTGEPVRGRESG